MKKALNTTGLFLVNSFLTLLGTSTFGAICFTFYTVIVNG